MITARHVLLTTGTILMISGCTVVGPDYTRPDTVIENNWVSSDYANVSSNQTVPIETEWWTLLCDPLLTNLIEQAADHNLDIKIAEANIREARANRSVQRSGMFPIIDSDATAQRQGISENGVVAPGQPVNTDYYSAGFDASYELDLFGGVQRSVEAASARISSAYERRRDILLSVLAETARNYIEFRGTQQRIDIAERNILLQRKTVEMTQRRFDAGESNDVELTRAKALLTSTEATLPSLMAKLRASAYRLAVLTGQEPQTLLQNLLTRKSLPATPDIVPVGLRSEILRRRPDIRQAERDLAASTAEIGVATSNLFPKFFLTGSAGVESLMFSSLFERGSTTWGLGPLIQWPIFRGGEIRAQIKAEEAQAEAAALNYEKAVLIALEETETALVQYGEELKTLERLQKNVSQYKKSATLAKRRYKAGLDNIIMLTDSEQDLANAQDNLVQSETRALTSLIALYKALGGGWESFDPENELSKGNELVR